MAGAAVLMPAASGAGTNDAAVTEWVVVLRKDFQNPDVGINMKSVAYDMIRRTVAEALTNRPADAKARVALRQEYSNHPAVDGLHVTPASAVALDENGQPDGVERFFDRDAWSASRAVPWKNGRRQGDEIVYDGKQVRAVIPWADDRVNGTRRTFHPNGRIMSEASYTNGAASGPTRAYDPEGRLVQEAEMKDGQRNGEARDYWPETGKVRRVTPYRMGKVVGVSREYYPDGALKREIPFRDNVLHGAEVLYDPDGKTREKRYWIDGDEVSEGEFKARFKA